MQFYCRFRIGRRPSFQNVSFYQNPRLRYNYFRFGKSIVCNRDKLHWLRARERITFKLCLLVYKARNGMAPFYMQDILCVPVSTVSTSSALRSAARGDLVIPRTRRRLGNRAFSVAGSAAWNSLPPDIRTASTLCTFKNLLKTHLFFHSFQLST